MFAKSVLLCIGNNSVELFLNLCAELNSCGPGTEWIQIYINKGNNKSKHKDKANNK
jgi:hypothetical protein